MLKALLVAPMCGNDVTTPFQVLDVNRYVISNTCLDIYEGLLICYETWESIRSFTARPINPSVASSNIAATILAPLYGHSNAYFDPTTVSHLS